MHNIVNALFFAIFFTLAPPRAEYIIISFIFNFIIFFGLYTICSSKGSKVPTRIVTGISSLLLFSNFIKFKFQNDFIYWWDINLLKDAIKVADKFYDKIFTVDSILFALTFIFVLILMDRLTINEFHFKTFIISTVLFVTVITIFPNNTFDLDESYNKNGKLIGLLKSIKIQNDTFAQGREKPTEEDKNLKYKLPVIDEKPRQINPDNLDVVIIQSETFFDIMKLNGKENISISKDVTKNFRKYQSEGIHGEVNVPVIGGMTCNSEFELLTGISARLFQKGSIVYTGYLKSETDSLAWRLKNSGYNTTAIHNYERDFWERDVKYPLLGFDEFISMESFKNPKKYDHWIADEEIFNKTIDVLDKKSGNNLVFTVTVQNHAPFSYKSQKDSVNVKGFSKQDTQSMKNYASGLYISDKALYNFMETIRKREKPTLVVFYGDHQPSYEHEYYKTMNYFKDENNRYKTDYFIWFNKPNTLDPTIENTSLIALGNKVKEIIGLTDDFDRFILEEYGFPNQDKYFDIKWGKENTYYHQSFTRFNNMIK